MVLLYSTNDDFFLNFRRHFFLEAHFADSLQMHTFVQENVFLTHT